MSDSTEDYVVVYRGFAARTIEMLEDMLRSEGLSPRREGRSNPAGAGVGMYALEQRIEVPLEHEQNARALIDAYERGITAEQSAALDAQALSTLQASDTAPRSWGRPMLYLVFVAVVAGLLWLAR